MGVYGLRSENILLKAVCTVVNRSEKRRFSCAADAFHFTNCRGLIELDGCNCNGQGDDALNIHGIYALSLIHICKEQVRYVSLLGRINYSYDNRYIATFTLRRDATSRFINDKWGTFLSGALAWNIDSERFMQNQNTVSALKLRLIRGEVGNSNVPRCV